MPLRPSLIRLMKTDQPHRASTLPRALNESESAICLMDYALDRTFAGALPPPWGLPNQIFFG